MIAGALASLCNALNEFIVAQAPGFADEAPAVVSDLVDQKGDLVIEATSRRTGDNILITLIRIEADPDLQNRSHAPQSPPPSGLNLCVLFSGHSGKAPTERYERSLELVSWVVRFFRLKPVFTRADTPDLPAEIERLVVEPMDTTLEEQAHLWGALGARHMPSAVYKIRMSIREPAS